LREVFIVDKLFARADGKKWWEFYDCIRGNKYTKMLDVLI
jgi:hypothetical protein